MGWSMVVHGPGPWGGPWTPVHVLHMSAFVWLGQFSVIKVQFTILLIIVHYSIIPYVQLYFIYKPLPYPEQP